MLAIAIAIMADIIKVSYLISVIVAVVFRDKQTLVWEFQWNLTKPLPYARVEVNLRCRYANHTLLVHPLVDIKVMKKS